MPETALGRIRALDYTVIYVRDMLAPRWRVTELHDDDLVTVLRIEA